MKILLINGSHRQGNTAFILDTIKNQISTENTKHLTTIINLREKNIDFCQEKDYNCTVTQNCPSCCRDQMK